MLILEATVPPVGEEPMRVPCEGCKQLYAETGRGYSDCPYCPGTGMRPVRYRVRFDPMDERWGSITKGRIYNLPYVAKHIVETHRTGETLPGVEIEEVSCD